tara:strand:- start:1968 stop:2318 length:351 start_codon:yes stop_codon:yes gene_type:complete
MNQKLLNKLYKKQAVLKKTNLGLQQDYESKKEEFLELNEKANDIFNELDRLKNEFQQIDESWYNAFNEQNDLGNELIFKMSELDLDISEKFDEQNEITNLYHQGDFTTEMLNFLRS